MAAVIGKNIMLYTSVNESTYYFNGGIDSTTISSVVYKQLSTTKNEALTVILNRTGDGLVAGFITPVGSPDATSISASTWVFNNYIALFEGLSGAPKFYIKVSKYNGTTLTEIARSSNVAIIDTGNRLYTTNVTIPSTSLALTDRIVVEIYSLDIGTRLIEWYTQGTSVNTALTTLPIELPFACSTNATWTVNVDQKEVTSQSSAWYREYKNDIANWVVTCDGLITLSGYGYLYLLQQQQSRQQISIKFAIDNGEDGLVIISGNCNLTSLSINAPYKDVGTYSVSLQGSGAYGTSGTNINQSGVVVIGGSVFTKGYTAAGGETTITYTDLVGKTALYISRGGIDVQDIISTGTPINEQVKWVSASGVLTFSRALGSGEYVRFLAQ